MRADVSPSELLGGVSLDVLDRVAHGLHGRSFFFRNRGDAELILESHNDLNEVERVGLEVGLEASRRGDLLSVDAQLFNDDVGYAFLDVFSHGKGVF